MKFFNDVRRALGGLAFLFLAPLAVAIEVDEVATIADSTQGFLGLGKISLSVRDLDSALAFYREATGFPVLTIDESSDDTSEKSVFGAGSYRSVTLAAPNLHFELIEFAENKDAPAAKMPPQGPGMTHTCFQSSIRNPGFDRFDAAGAETISYGGKPVDLGGYGVTYAYAYDPEGNMIELEQLDAKMLKRSGYMNTEGIEEHPLWMSQVALATPDIERLMSFYENLLGFKPYRVAELMDNPKADAIAGIDGLDILGGWFRLNKSPEVLEIWQYRNPATAQPSGRRTPRSLGYSYVLDVRDVQRQYERFTKLGIKVFSKPLAVAGGLQFYAADIDGNVFAVRQRLDASSASASNEAVAES